MTTHMNSENMMIPRSSPSPVRSLLVGGSLLLALAAPSLTQAQTPLIQYNFNEGTGTSAANTGSLAPVFPSTTSNLILDATHSSWATAASTLSGTGSALIIDGAGKNSTTSGYQQADGTGLNTNLSAFTITLWVNLTTAGASERLVTFADGSVPSHGFDFRLNTLTGEQASLGLFVDGTTVTSTGGNIVDVVGQWTFVAVTYDGNATTNNVSFYYGGSSVSATVLGSAVTANKGAIDTVNNQTTALRVGSSGTTNVDRTPAGVFDDVRIYGSVLDASAIEAVRVSAIPEPATTALLMAGAGLIGAVILRRRRRG